MKILQSLFIGAAVLGLAACNSGAQEQKADNIEANAEMQADNLEDAADVSSNETTEDKLEDQADVVREKGEEQADATRTGPDLDGNSANDTLSGNSSNR